MSLGKMHSHVALKADETTATYELFKFNPHSRDTRDRVQLTNVDCEKMHLWDFVLCQRLPKETIKMRRIYLSFAPAM
jgi:hypothetical protein